jgi:hypothetical protein
VEKFEHRSGNRKHGFFTKRMMRRSIFTPAQNRLHYQDRPKAKTRRSHTWCNYRDGKPSIFFCAGCTTWAGHKNNEPAPRSLIKQYSIMENQQKKMAYAFSLTGFGQGAPPNKSKC